MFIYQKNDNILVANASGRTVCVYSDENIVSYTHHEEDGHGVLYCVSGVGDVLRISEQQIVQRSSDTEDDSEEAVEIFEDLLRTEEDDVLELKLSTELVTVLNDKDVLDFSKENGRTIGICVGCGFLILHKSSNVLEVYVNAPGSSDYSDPMILHLSVHNQSEYPSSLPVPSKFEYPTRLHKDESGMIVKILTCDYVENADCDAYNDPGVIRINTDLYRELYGADVMLRSMSVILVCPCDEAGLVMYTTLPTNYGKSSQDCLNNLESGKICDWTSLCQMSSSVVAIYAISLANDTESGSEISDRSALCICSRDGHVTVFHCGNSTPGCMVSELYVCSPVLAMCSFNNRLNHSTGNQLFESTCELLQGNDQRSNGRLAMKSKILNETNITELYVSTVEGHIRSLNSPCQLYCVLKNKDIKTITVPLEVNPETSTQIYRQENIKEILKSMDRISKQKNDLLKQTSIQRKCIQQLNVASFLMNFNLESNSNCDPSGLVTGTVASAESRKGPFHLNFAVTQDTNRSDKDFLVECELTNQMPVSMSHDWVISINIDQVGGDKECITVSNKLQSEWKQGKKLTLSIPITYRQCLAGCKLIVKATLLGDNFGRHLGKNRNEKRLKSSSRVNYSVSGFEGSLCISIPVFEEELDVIHCLIPEDKYTDHVCVQSMESRCLLTQLARNRISSLESMTPDVSPTTVCTRSVLQLPGTTPLLKQEALRELFGSGIVSKTDVKNGSCHLKTLDGQSVNLNFFNKGDNRTYGPSGDGKKMKHSSGCHGDWEVTVRSTPELAAAVHKVLIRRESLLMKHCGMKAEKVYVADAHKALANVKELTRQLEDCIKKSSSDEYKTISMVFEKLRNIRL